jgi:4-hydroxy-2-oxoheptanedioate aldolase
MDGFTLKQTLKEGKRVYGFMLSAMASTRFANVLKGSTVDYAIIDSEHGSRDRAEIQQLCTMLRQADVAPVVRVPVPKAEYVAMALDAGASGVLVPYCETVAEVEAVVATAKWHPLKGAYLKKAISDNELPSEASRAYLEKRHKHSFVIIGIESVPGYENLDEILKVGDIDGVFVGPNDLSTSLGIPDDYSNPHYIEVVRDIISKCEMSGVPVMVHQQTIETSTLAMELGARFVLHAMDSNILQRALQNEFNALRKNAGEIKSVTSNTVDVA